MIDPTRESLERLLQVLTREDFYVSHEAAVEEFGRGGQFNANRLDRGYVERWLDALEVRDLWGLVTSD